MTAGTRTSPTLDLTRPGFVEASAGTGKTFTIAEIYLALLRGEKRFAPRERDAAGTADESPTEDRTGTPPRVGEILVVTFTDAATAELRDRLRRRIRDALKDAAAARERVLLRLADSEFDESAIFTIHGFCLRVLKDFGISARTDDVVSSPDDEFARFVSRWRARRIAAGEKIFFDVSAKEIGDAMKPPLRNPELVPAPPENASDARGNALFRAATEAVREWTAQRKAAKNISYGEMLIELRDALRADPALAKKIAARFRVAVVDEFQDTDPVQWEIFRRIFLANRRPIFCVGDPKQAIYEFRGGDIRAYRRARAEILEAGSGNALTLDENFRSEPETIAAFNEIFSFDAKISCELFAGTPKNPRAFSAPIAGTLEYAPVAFPRIKAKALGAEELAARERVPAAVLKIAPAASNREEAKKSVAEDIALDVANLVGGGVPAGSIAVLVSDNKEANLYRALLSREKVPVSTTARGNVLCEPIARALADVMRAMLDPQNAALFRRALITPFFAGTGTRLLLGAEDSVAGTVAFPENLLPEEVFVPEFFPDESEEAQQAFADAHERWARSGFLPAFRTLSERLGFSENLATLPDAPALATNVAHLTELIHARERAAGFPPRTLADAFGAMLAGASDDDDSDDVQLRADNDGAAVQILTVHKSKGLEFDFVFVPSLWAKSLLPPTHNPPASAKRTGADGRTELLFDAAPAKGKSENFLRAAAETAGTNAASLFYVALTRARKRVVVHHVPQSASGARRGVWESYQKKILEAAGFFSEDEDARRRALPHWTVVPAFGTLPPESFPQLDETRAAEAQLSLLEDKLLLIPPDEARERFVAAESAMKKLARDAEGVFSFSKIIHATDSDDATARRENDDETRRDGDDADASDSAAAGTPASIDEISFPRQNFSDLPVGAEFGTIAHLVFEKTDFRSRENLPRVLDAVLPQLPRWAETPAAERRALRRKFAEMVEANLALPLLGARGFRLEELGEGDFASEMEFHFPLKRSRDAFDALSRIFGSWGGVYAETAERHWSPRALGAGTPLSIGGMMTGVVDLAFRADGKFFILDWKTNVVAPRGVPADFRLPLSAVREEIVKHGYALQWAIYALALRKFLRRSLGDAFDWDRDFGGIVYLFVRWLAPYFEAGTLSSERLDALERVFSL